MKLHNENFELINNKPNYEEIIVKLLGYNKLYSERYKNLKNLNLKLEQVSSALKIVNEDYENGKQSVIEYFQSIAQNRTMKYIYKLMEPNKEFTDIVHEIVESSNRIELYTKIVNSTGDKIVPEMFFSTAQLNTLSLSLFLGEVLNIDDLQIKTILMDDPISAFDDINILSFIDVMRCLISEGYQIIFSTHDSRIYDILQVKLSDEYHNSKFIEIAKL